MERIQAVESFFCSRLLKNTKKHGKLNERFLLVFDILNMLLDSAFCC